MLEMILSISIIILAGIVLCLNIKLLKQLKKIEENNKKILIGKAFTEHFVNEIWKKPKEEK